MIFILSVLFLSGLIPILLIGNAEITTTVFLATILLSYVGIQLSILMLKGKASILQLTFWIFVYVWLGFSAIQQIINERYPWGHQSYTENDLIMSITMIFVGCISYQVGQKLCTKKTKSLLDIEFSIKQSKLWYLGVISVVISLLIIYTQQGFNSLFSARLDSTSGYGSKIELLIYSNLSHIPIFCILLVALMQKPRQKLLIFFLLIANLIINNPISNARYLFGSIFLALAFTLIPWKRWNMAKWVYGILILLILVFPYADMFRATTNLEEIKFSSVQTLWTDKGDFDAFQMVENSRIYTQIYGFSYGKQLLGCIFFFVPRSIWVNKPYGTGQTIGEGLGYSFTNLSCPLWSEFYVNFGWYGIVVGFMLYGYMTRRLEIAYMQMKEGITFFKVIVPFLAAYQLFLLRGDLMNGIAYLFLFLSVVGALMLTRSINKTKESRDASFSSIEGQYHINLI